MVAARQECSELLFATSVLRTRFFACGCEFPEELGLRLCAETKAPQQCVNGEHAESRPIKWQRICLRESKEINRSPTVGREERFGKGDAGTPAEPLDLPL